MIVHLFHEHPNCFRLHMCLKDCLFVKGKIAIGAVDPCLAEQVPLLDFNWDVMARLLHFSTLSDIHSSAFFK